MNVFTNYLLIGDLPAEESPRPAPTGEKRKQEEDTVHTEEEQGEAVGH